MANFLWLHRLLGLRCYVARSTRLSDTRMASVDDVLFAAWISDSVELLVNILKYYFVKAMKISIEKP